jgi:DNA-binding NarL/FixJ family response regulator
VHGERLRQQRRRADAQESASQRARRARGDGRTGLRGTAQQALNPTGGHARRARASADDLTPQEARIALPARDGLTNAQIAAQLFISPRTVEYHLHKVVARLHIDHGARAVKPLGARRVELLEREG